MLDDHRVWANQPAFAPAPLPPEEKWWTSLEDPVLDGLIDAAFASSPSVALAAAHLDEARAVLGLNTAQSRPQVSFNASAERARVQSGGGGIGGGGGNTVAGSELTGGPTQFRYRVAAARPGADAPASRVGICPAGRRKPRA
jgi:multidrug efflux system outer membrane protein